MNEGLQKKGLLVVFGRRRIGKTRLLAEWLFRKKGIYTQAIEGSQNIQIKQVFQDIQHQLKLPIVPKYWDEFFRILDLVKKKVVLCIDEFPYLVASNPSLPSIIQKWLDHRKKKNVFIILSGSSTHMMHETFLNAKSPLYGRATNILHLKPMAYVDFCTACKLNRELASSFEKYALVGGVPKYWESVERRQTILELADALYFGFSPYMEYLPRNVLSESNINSTRAQNLLEVVGRGAHRPFEMASRLQTAQTNLSRVLQQLMDASLLKKEIPYGQSARSSKQVLYSISDPALRFWFHVYSPHRSLWSIYDKQKKMQLISQHISTVFEDFCRQQSTGGVRYWEKNIEFDIVRPSQAGDSKSDVVVSEVKWSKLSDSRKQILMTKMKSQWTLSKLSRVYKLSRFEIMDQSYLRKKRKSKAL